MKAQTKEQPAHAETQEQGLLDEVIEESKSLTGALSERWGIREDKMWEYGASFISSDERPPWTVVAQFLTICREHELNPAKKEIAAFWSSRKGLTTFVMIDGWITLANRQPKFDGFDYEYERTEDGELVSVTCNIYRTDRTRPTKVRVKMSEWRVGGSPQWMSKPEWMLEVKAFKQCSRFAFGFAGLVDDDDAQRIMNQGKAEKKPVNTAAKITLKDLKPGEKPPEDEYERKPEPEGGSDDSGVVPDATEDQATPERVGDSSPVPDVSGGPSGSDEPQEEGETAPEVESPSTSDSPSSESLDELRKQANITWRKFGHGLSIELQEAEVSDVSAAAVLRANGWSDFKVDHLRKILDGKAEPLTEDQLICLHQNKGVNISTLQAVLKD